MKAFRRALLIAFAIVAVGIVSYHFSTQNKFRLRQWEAPVAQMRLVDFKHEFNRQEFLPAIWADFTIVNDNSYPVKDLRIYCAFQDAAGAKVKDMTLHLYTIVPAKSQRREHHNLASLTKEIENASCILFDAHRHFE